MKTYEVTIRARIIASEEPAINLLTDRPPTKPSLSARLLAEGKAVMERLAEDPHVALLPGTVTATIQAEAEYRTVPAYVPLDKEKRQQTYQPMGEFR